MDSYTINFGIALALFEFILLFFVLKRKVFCLLLFVYPLLCYVVYYDYNVGLVQSRFIYLIGYIGCLWTLVFVLFFVQKKDMVGQTFSGNSLSRLILCCCLQIVLVLLYCALNWAVDTFPLSNPDAVLFTLFAPVDGAGEFVVSSLLKRVFFDGLCLALALIVLQVVFSMLAEYRQTKSLNFRKRFFSILSVSLIFMLGCDLIKMLVLPGVVDSPAFKAFFEESVDSDFYKENYIEPGSFNVPQKTKNLVVLFVESMAVNFEQYTPELNECSENGISFRPGGVSVAGTSWTVAGITAAMCGLPLNMPLGIGEYLGKLPTYLPNAKCVMEFLNDAGYNQLAIQGSSADFTQLRSFWKVHGGVNINDDAHYKENGKLDKDYRVFWGMEDKKTLNFARQELNSLSKSDKPFAAYISTIDTHQPDGYLDPDCSYNENSQYKNVLRCSSAQISDFLHWMSSQEWFEKTIILVVGDHTMPPLAEKAGVPKVDTLKTLAFILNAGEANKKIEKQFTNLDYAPTILESLGWDLPKHSFALGRSLFSDEKTMLEIYGKDSLDVLLRQKSIQYNYFLYGK